VSRAVGFRWAAVSGLLERGQGCGRRAASSSPSARPGGAVAAALAAIVGHSRSPFIGFHGGRGVAPATGGALIIAPPILAVIFPSS